MRQTHFARLLSVLLALAVPAGASHAGFIANADFSQKPLTGSDPFTDWTTYFGNSPVTDEGGIARFAEDTVYSATQLQQVFMLPADGATLSFEFRLTAAASLTPARVSVPDGFQATLWDSGFSTSFGVADPMVGPGYFSVDATGQQFYDARYVRLDSLADGWTRVTLDLGALPLRPTDAAIEFILNGGDDGRDTTVDLRDVVGTAGGVTAVPAPPGLALALSGLAAAGGCGLSRRLRGPANPKPAKPERG